ncbi:hypothetical protein F5Y16DRAFT_379664, partial [Xylariaceae sp. FL0255]
ETNRSSTIQGEPTNPTGRIFFRQILPWDEYLMQQEKIWSLLDGLLLCSDVFFPSSETDLRHFARETVENVVQKLCDAVFGDSQLRACFDNISILVIEYKAPYKLTWDEVDGEGFAVLFIYMVDKGIRYGYVYTGETLVFLRILDDPSVVYYYVCVPNLDVGQGDEDWLHYTAVAQVFAFVLQALRARPLPQTWHDHAKSLDIWAVEFEDVLRNIPETDRKPTKNNPGLREKSDSDDDNGPPSLSASRSLRTSTKVTSAASTTVRNVKLGRRGGGNRPFCTAKCLLGLANGGLLDKQLRLQLANDRGLDTDAMPLYFSGSVGALFKGVEKNYFDRLQQYVSVCLGLVDLVLPYYYDGGVFVSKDAVITAVLYYDTEPRNVLYNAQNSYIMIVDFERAKLLNRKRKHTYSKLLYILLSI